MKLDPGDALVGVAEVAADNDLMLATRQGRAHPLFPWAK